MPHYNTTKENQDQVRLYELLNMKQEDKVLEMAKQLKTFSASYIYNHYPVAYTPLTSIRRAIHTLEYSLKVIKKTGKKVKSIYGRNEHQYQFIT